MKHSGTVSSQDGAYVIMMQTILNFANLTIWMHIHAQIVLFVQLLNLISCNWCKYLLQSLFKTQLIRKAIILMKNIDQWEASIIFLSINFKFRLVVIHSFSLSICLLFRLSLFLSVFLSYCLSGFLCFCRSVSKESSDPKMKNWKI